MNTGDSATHAVNNPEKAFKNLRFEDASVAIQEYRRALLHDPQRQKRAAILANYYQYPHKVGRAEAKDCIARDPARANHGMLRFHIDQAKQPYLEMLYERQRTARIEGLCKERKKEDMEEQAVPLSKIEQEDLMSEAWDSSIMDMWPSYHADKELEIQDLLLYSRAVSAVLETNQVYPEYIPIENFLPNIGAGQAPSSWEWVFVYRELPAVVAYRRCRDEEWGWDLPTLARAMKWAGTRQATEADCIRAEQDGSIWRTLEPARVNLLYLFVKEWDGSITRRIMPDYYNGGWSGTSGRHGAMGKRVESSQGKDENRSGYVTWLHVEENFVPADGRGHEDWAAPKYDDHGHGKFYHTPSLAEKYYLQSKEYDTLMNKAKDAAGLNSMLLFEGQVDQSRRMRVLRDHIVMEPGTAPSQVRYNLPVAESVAVAEKLMADFRGAAGIGQVRTTGPRKNKNEVARDSAITDAPSATRLRRYNRWHQEEFNLLWRRFNKEARKGGPEVHDKALDEFLCTLKEAGLEIDDKDMAKAKIKSVLLSDAGSPDARYRKAVEGYNLLRMQPRTDAEARLRKLGLGALFGADNVTSMLSGESVTGIPDDRTRKIGWENNMLSIGTSNPQMVPILQGDRHVLHLFGDIEQGGTVIGHIPVMSSLLNDGLSMIEMFPRVPVSDQPMLANRVQEVISAVENFIEHCGVHIGFLASTTEGDGSESEEHQVANVQYQQAIRLLAELKANFGQIQEARSRDAQQQGPDAMAAMIDQGKKELEMMKVEAARQKGELDVAYKAKLADIGVAAKMMEANAKAEAILTEANARAEAARQQAATKMASEAVKAAQTSKA